jgi:hypothetical protein
MTCLEALSGKKFHSCQMLVAHSCNPSYLQARDQEDHCWKPALANSSQDPILKKTYHKKGLVEWLKETPVLQTKQKKQTNKKVLEPSLAIQVRILQFSSQMASNPDTSCFAFSSTPFLLSVLHCKYWHVKYFLPSKDLTFWVNANKLDTAEQCLIGSLSPVGSLL